MTRRKVQKKDLLREQLKRALQDLQKSIEEAKRLRTGLKPATNEKN